MLTFEQPWLQALSLSKDFRLSNLSAFDPTELRAAAG
jgi:hypothetical protein